MWVHTQYVCISPRGGNDKKPGEIPQNGASPQTQSCQDDGSQFCKTTAGREQQEGASPLWISAQNSPGCLVFSPDCLRATAEALYDIRVFKLLSWSWTGRVFLLKQQLCSVLASLLKQKGYSWTPFKPALSLLLASLQRAQDRLHKLPSSLGIPVWVQPAESTKVCLKARSWAVIEFNPFPFLLEIDPEEMPRAIFQYQELVEVLAPWNTGVNPFGGSKLKAPWVLAWGK